MGAAFGQTPSPTYAQDLSKVPELTVQEVQKSASNGQYQIGDRIPLSIEIKSIQAEPGETISLKPVDETTKLEDLGWYIDPSTQFLGGNFRFLVSPIQTGRMSLPPLFVLKSDQTIIGKTSPYVIQVTGPSESESKTAELIDPSKISLATRYWILFGLMTVMLVGGVFYGIRKYRSLRKKELPPALPTVPVDPEHVVALKKIEALYGQYPYSIENLKPLSFGISEILKEFFARRFKVGSLESTSDEMIELLRREAISGENLREIQVLFQDLDLVKFTKRENYSHFDEDKYLNFKIKSNLIIQKWALRRHSSEGSS